MDHGESFSLQWDQFESNLGSKFADLRGGEHFSDVTLVSEDGQVVKAHKVLLSATSPVLEAILKSQDHTKPLIFMRGVKTDVLSSLLDFIYFGQVKIYFSLIFLGPREPHGLPLLVSPLVRKKLGNLSPQMPSKSSENP